MSTTHERSSAHDADRGSRILDNDCPRDGGCKQALPVTLAHTVRHRVLSKLVDVDCCPRIACKQSREVILNWIGNDRKRVLEDLAGLVCHDHWSIEDNGWRTGRQHDYSEHRFAAVAAKHVVRREPTSERGGLRGRIIVEIQHKVEEGGRGRQGSM